MPNQFTIYSNEYLEEDTIGYYNQWYTGHRQPNNPDFLNKLKNTFNDESTATLNAAKNEVVNVLLVDILAIMRDNAWDECVCVCIPRAKSLDTYFANQLFFRDAVSSAAFQILNVVDGSNFIVRHTNTCTTHLGLNVPRKSKQGRVENNDGESPYVGITNATCTIESAKIDNQNIILIDDIYTRSLNIDEDCIQALLDAGARKVIFYAVAYTQRA